MNFSLKTTVPISIVIHEIRVVHSNKCNVRLPYVKHALNVRYKTYIKRMDRAPYV